MPSRRCARDKGQHGVAAKPCAAGFVWPHMTSADGLLLLQTPLSEIMPLHRPSCLLYICESPDTGLRRETDVYSSNRRGFSLMAYTIGSTSMYCSR
jgi:hypothetical protein